MIWWHKDPSIYQTWCSTSSFQMYQLSNQHDDVIKWKHFPRYWPFVRGIHRSPVNSPTKASDVELMFSLICTCINGWINNGDAGDLRRHHAHYQATVMSNSVWCYLITIIEYRHLVLIGEVCMNMSMISNTECRRHLCSLPDWAFEQTVNWTVNWDAQNPLVASFNVLHSVGDGISEVFTVPGSKVVQGDIGR